MTKRAYLVMPRNTRVAERGLKTGKGTLTFKGKTSMMIGDPSLASEVNSAYGLRGTGDVWVEPDDRTSSWLRDDGGTHRYFWGSSSAFRRGWEAIFNKERQNG